MQLFSDYLYPKAYKHLSVGAQILIVALLFTAYTIYSYFEYQSSGTMFGYPLSISILFVPIYEEIIFRGIILIGLTRFYSVRNSVIISSLLFGLWHFKNIFWLDGGALAYQMLYTALFFGPIAAYLTIKSKSIWLAIIFHYLNNILARAWPLIGVLFGIH